MVGYAYLLWFNADIDSFALAIGSAVGIINLVGAILILWWAPVSQSGLSSIGFTVLCLASTLLFVFAVGEISFVVTATQNRAAAEL